MSQRELYIDHLRSAMTVLVILHHTAITYGASGGWFYYELKPSTAPSSMLLTLFAATNQAYFMGFFFLLAGYFTPASLERKGYARFICDRFSRLGIPLLAFIVFLGPLTAALVNAAQGKGFWSTFVWLWNHHEIINGPLWFAQALLLFSIGYCAWRAAAGSPISQTEREPKAVPHYWQWLLSAVLVGMAALVIRQFVPTGVNVAGLQLGYFASYIFLFALGICAWRFEWLQQLQWKNVRPWIFTLVIAWPCLPLGIKYAFALYGPAHANFSGGLSWPAILYAMWEPFVAWGLIGLWLLLFRTYVNQSSGFGKWLNRRAYSVYIIHPPVVVSISLLLHSWMAPALLKFAATGALSCATCWILSDPLVRLPGLRRIL